MSYQPAHTLITRIEVQSLGELKAPASVYQVVLALNSFAMNLKESCFPALTTIRSWLGESLSLRSIERAIKWLVDNDIIVRNHKRSKNRFVLKLRAAAKKVLFGQPDNPVGAKPIQPDSFVGGREKEKERDNFYIPRIREPQSQRPQKSGWFAKKRSRNAKGGLWGIGMQREDRRTQIERESDQAVAFYAVNEHWKLSPSEEQAILQRIESDLEWSHWLKQHHGALFSQIVRPLQNNVPKVSKI